MRVFIYGLVRTCIHSVKCTCLYYVSKKSNLNLQNITNSSFSLIKIKEMTQCKTQTCHVHWPGMLTTACFAPTPNAKQAPADNRQWPQYARIVMSWWYLLYPRYACLMGHLSTEKINCREGAQKKLTDGEEHILLSDV